jgi:hypothetical protein
LRRGHPTATWCCYCMASPPGATCTAT